MVGTGGGIPGGIGHSGTGESWLAFYVEVGDLQAKLDRAEELGATTVLPVTELPMLSFAMFTDPDGLLVGLMKASEQLGGAPPPGAGAPVDWFEVLGSDAKRSQALYGDLFGWSFEDADASYGLVDTGAGRGISGGIGASAQGSMWATVYANVDEVERALARAEELGGKREYGPIDVDDHMQSGAIRDPVGNVIGVYHHESH